MNEQTRHKTALVWLVVAVVTVVGLAAGCGSPSSTPSGGSDGTQSRANKDIVESDAKPRVGGKLAYGLLAETNGWNPALNQWAASGLQVARAIFDTITTYDENSQVKPFLAESFDHNPEFTEWTFKLRPGVKLHNGKPVTADTVVRSQQFLMRSAIVGGAYRYSGVTDISAVDELTFRVKLKAPSAIWPIAMASQLGVVTDPDWLASNDGLKPIGTGPFKLDSWEIDKRLIVKKNPDYWRTDRDGTRLPYLEEIEFRVMTQTESRTKALQANDVDVIETLSGNQVAQFQQLDGFQVFSDSKGESRERSIMLNTKAEPFTDPDVRRALAYATDAEAFSDVTSSGFYEVARGPVAPNSPWYAATDFPTHDPAKAKELVEKAKAKHGGKIAFTLRGGPDPEVQLGAQALQQQWTEAGFEVTIEQQEQAKLIIGVVSGNYQATMWTQFDAPIPFADGVFLDPEGAVPPPDFSLNFTRNDDPAIGEALHAGAAAPTFEEQHKHYAIVQQRLAEDVPYVWLAHERVALIASDRIVNLVRYTLPDGSKGLDLQQGAHQLAQVWIR